MASMPAWMCRVNSERSYEFSRCTSIPTGFELGSGLFVNTAAPEVAAEQLRAVATSTDSLGTIGLMRISRTTLSPARGIGFDMP